MQLSEKQLAANRSNARLSTGPRTVGGKRNSSLNATTHGFLAQSILLPGESRPRFLRLVADLTTQFEPANPTEFMLVETMAVTRWRILRLWTLETAGLVHEQRCQSESTTEENHPTRTMLALRALAHPPRSQETLSRYEVRFDRQYHRAADRLLRLQARREENRQRNEEKQKNEEKQQRSHHPAENKGQPVSRQPIRTIDEASTKPDQRHIEPPARPTAIGGSRRSRRSSPPNKRSLPPCQSR